MVYEFKLPDVAEGVHEGEIVQWHVKEGQAVKEDQDMVEVMTDKATVMIKAPKAGTIGRIIFPEGKVAKVGDVIVTIEVGGAPSAPGSAAAAPARPGPSTDATMRRSELPAVHAAPPPAKAADAEKTLFDLETDSSSMFRQKKRGTPNVPAAHVAPGAVSPQQQQQVQQPPAANGGKVLAAPALRRRAREQGVDLAQVRGSGPAGRVTTYDFEQFLAGGSARGPQMQATVAPAPAPAPALALPAEGERVPLKGLRKAIFNNMRTSEDFVVPFSYWDEFDVTDLVKLRKDASQLAEQQGVKLTYLPFIVKAVVSGLKRFPDVNAHVDEQSPALVRRAAYNVGVATATERGLMVVVVKDADQKSIFEIAKEIETLSEKARAGKASPDDLKGSTFTITSLGKDGGLGATPVVNHPEAAILGVHKIEARAKVNEKREVVVRDCMNLSASFDHRWIDGHVGAAFVQHVGRLLAQPHLLLLGTA